MSSSLQITLFFFTNLNWLYFHLMRKVLIQCSYFQRRCKRYVPIQGLRRVRTMLLGKKWRLTRLKEEQNSGIVPKRRTLVAASVTWQIGSPGARAITSPQSARRSDTPRSSADRWAARGRFCANRSAPLVLSYVTMSVQFLSQVTSFTTSWYADVSEANFLNQKQKFKRKLTSLT